MSETMELPMWHKGIPSEEVMLVVVEYMDGYEFAMYRHKEKIWEVCIDSEFTKAQEEIKRFAYLPWL